jgi:Ca-activated chloride channel homolog
MAARDLSIITLGTAMLLLCSCVGSFSSKDDSGSWAEGDTDTDSDADGDTDSDADTDAIDDEPDEPEDTEQPEDTAVEDCDDETPITLWISPDDSNSMSSPAMVRDAALGGWSSLSNISVRSWEFMNYYRFDFERPEPGQLAITAAAVPAPSGEEGTWAMQIGVASPGLDKADRDPMNLVFSLDTSGSMGGSPIELLKESCEIIASQLMEGDVVSMVTWNSSQEVVLESHVVAGPSDTTLLGAIRGISANGSTDLNQGLVSAYQLAEGNYDSSRINRVILISDGGANVGVTEKELIALHSEREDGEGIYLMGVGVGTAQTYNDALMDTVTDEGKGAAVFIGSSEEAEAIFRDRFLEVLDVSARDVAVRLDLPPGFEMVRFSGEEYSSDPMEIEPQHLAPNDAMVFQQHISTCAPDLLDADPEITVEVTWKDAVSFEAQSQTLTMSWSELTAASSNLLWKGEAVFDYALAMKARRGRGTIGYTEAYGAWENAQLEAEARNPGDEDLVEIREVMTAVAP